MKKFTWIKKALAVLLTLTMIAGYLPVMSNAAELTVSNKIADPETLYNYRDYYGENSLLPDGSRGISTWKAGGVWTDKSVFASDADIAQADLPTSLTDKNAFLVSLSALASTKEVIGQSTAPTDTMLVLDLSNSMDNSGSVPTMVQAANATLDTLLKMNVNNRVGVVLYSGNSRVGDSDTSTATVILPLDHYTTTSSSNGNAQYLTVSGRSDTTVNVANGTRNSSNQKPSGSKNTIGGTYIQNGLYKAYQQFAGMADKGVVQSGTQKGVQRTPIIVLMSDGAPTAATTSYNNIGKSNKGDGTQTTDVITFLTQLTAAWTKGSVSAHYNNTTAKFYTLGLGTANDSNATAVLYPAGSNSTLNSYWNNFNKGTSNGSDVTISNSLTVKFQSVAKNVGKNYVDMYKSANNTNDLLNAFQEIVDEIGLQSAYTATLVESGKTDLDGYITVEDELGSMMEVKDVKGILMGNTLFSGAEFAKSINAGDLGSNSGNATEYGTEFINTVKERLGIDTSTAQQLVNAAYNDGQLSYTNNSVYSNYLGWYGDADNNYLGFWDKDTGLTGTGAPSGAKYINKCYLYLGEARSSDMMHVIVQVRTEIANGHQTVLLKVPASLIPTVRYYVELEGDSLETATDITLTVEEEEPIRLLYEVGLPSDVNEVNLEQKVSEYLTKDGSNHIHKNADGSYTFYANSWGAEHEQAPNIPAMTDAQKQDLTKSVAESHFIPNTANERFYILEDSQIYTKSGNRYVAVTSAPVAGNDYYFARTIINVTGAGGKAEAVTQYELLYPATVANADNFMRNSAGNWVVKAGTPRQSLSNLGLLKTSNDTDTIVTSDQLWVRIAGDSAQDHHIYSFLGNNGKLTVMPTSGIKVTKDVTELAEGQSTDEKFPIVVTLSQAANSLQVTDAEGKLLSAEAYSVSNDGKTVTLYLADGQTAYLAGLASGTAYTVSESHDKYTPSYIYEYADKVVRAGYVDGVTVTNEPVRNGSLYITKEVEPYMEGEPYPTMRDFEFAVTFLDAEGNPIANHEFDMVNNYDGDLSRSTDANGVMIGWLRHGETVHITGIPAGANVTVEEVNIQENYTLKSYRSRNASGEEADDDGQVTIQSGQNATVVVTNTYTPKPTTVDLDVVGTKNFDVQGLVEAQQAGSFTFLLEQWNGQQWVAVENKTATLHYAEGEGDSTKNFTIENVLEGVTFTHSGTYSYQVREKIGTVANVTYDATLWTFTVTVADVNGQLTATVTDMNNEVITDGSYEVTFNNSLHTVPVTIDIVKNVVDTSNNPLTSKAGFEFVAQTAELVDGKFVVKEGGRSFSVFSDGVGEARMTDVYKTEGTYYYIISERAGGKAGWSYDATQYWISVDVSKDGSGQGLLAELEIYAVDGDGNVESFQIGGDSTELTFTNTYDPADVQVSLETLVDKKLTGRALQAGEFQFAIYPDGQTGNPIATGTNDANGNVVFTPGQLSFSRVGKYAYDVLEISNQLGGVTYDNIIYDLVIEITDEDQNGQLEANYYFEDSTEKTVVFQNIYQAGPTELVIDGLKTLVVNSGWKELTAGMFTFGLFDSNGDQIATTTNRANGTFAFEPILYYLSDVGSYTYTVKEISGAMAGITYDNAEFTVSVEVVDNGDGTMSAIATGNGAENIEFVNTYNAKPVSVTLSGNKNMAGRELEAGEFTYAIYSSDAAFANRTLITDQITHDADGQIVFELGTLGMGYHYFVLKEVIPEEREAGIHYDASEYHVTVQVTDRGTGEMSAITTLTHTGSPNVVNPEITFKNIYRPNDTSVLIEGTKVLEGGKPLTEGAFSFVLMEGDTELGQAQVKADGSFAFDTITFTADDIGTHTYTVQEQLPQGATAENGWVDGNITYDPTVYTVTITVADNEGVLEVTQAYSVEEAAANSIVFTNTHTPDPVPFNLEAQKEYNKAFGAGTFTFTLEGEDIEKQEKTNDANGKVVFDTLWLTEAKTYTFTVNEKEEILWGFISWDKSEYTVTVTVENQDGVLVITEQTISVGEEAQDGGIVFENEYVLEGDGQVELSGVKTLTGDRTTLEAGEFTFGLYDASGALIESVTNDADGNFAFAPLTYDETDVSIDGAAEYTYTVKEIAGTNSGMTYDETVYTVTVTVADNNQGGITVDHTITENGAAAQIAFENAYSITGNGSVQIAGTKTYEGKVLQGEDFTFVLSQNGTELQQVKNAADGTFAFAVIEYTKADIGVHTYTVSELRPADAQQLEDGSYMKDGTIYDANVYTVEVTVADDGNGGLLVTQKVNNQAVEQIHVAFDNAYQIFGAGQLTLTGTKTLTGGKPLADGEFQFGLYDENGQLIAQAENKDGAFQLVKQYTAEELGQYTYTVAEILPQGAEQNADGSWSMGNITFDSAVYTVKVIVADDQKGGIDVSYELQDAEAITFENSYTPDNHVVNIDVRKILDNKTDKKLSPEGFVFEMTLGSNTYTAKSDAAGKTGFEITFGAAHIGQTYEIKVREQNTGIKGMTYDKTVHTIKVQVLQNEDGTIKSLIDGQEATRIEVAFTNVYEELETPPTGDNFNMILPLVLMLLSVLGVVLVISTRKKKAA